MAITDFSRLRFDSILLSIQAAVSGLGIALEGGFLVGEELAAGRLFVPHTLRHLSVRKTLRYSVVPETQAKSEKVLVFRDWLFRTINE